MIKLTSPEIRWKKGHFSNIYLIFKNDREVGHLTQKYFSQNAEGRLNETQLIFKSSNPFCQKVEILDQNRKSLGLIKYNLWKTEAELQLNGKVYRCKMDGLFKFSLSIYHEHAELFKFEGSSTKGVVKGEEIEDEMILSGLYLMNYYIELFVSIVLIVFVVFYF